MPLREREREADGLNAVNAVWREARERQNHFDFCLPVSRANGTPRHLGTLPGSFVGMLDKDSSWEIISRSRTRLPSKNYLPIVIYVGEHELAKSDLPSPSSRRNLEFKQFRFAFSTIWDFFFIII